MSGPREPRLDAAFALARFALCLRWLALGATLFLSCHHWMRVGYWEFSGVWQYGLVLLDPRVPAALLWWLIQTAFFVLVLLPTAEWLSTRLPTTGRPRAIAAVALAIGLGTRGIVGPLIVRAAVAAPAILHTGDGEQVRSWLTNPYSARWLVALTEAWWLLPFLVLALHLTAPTWAGCPAERWRVRGLLALYALLQSVDAPYLLTAGGPRGATSTLQLIAVHEGWGRQEFGYASVITVLLCAAGAAAIWVLPVGSTATSARASGRTSPNTLSWVLLAALSLGPLAAAAFRGLSWNHTLPPLATLSATATCVAAASVWTGALGVALSLGLPLPETGLRNRLPYAGLLFPSLVLFLPMLRPLGVRSADAAAWAALVAMACLAPYLGLSTVTARALSAVGAGRRTAFLITTSVIAWAGWTDLSLPLLLSQGQHPLLPLQGWMLWDLSTHLRASPLSVPGWSVAWITGSLLAGFTAFRLLGLWNAADSGIGTDVRLAPAIRCRPTQPNPAKPPV